MSHDPPVPDASAVAGDPAIPSGQAAGRATSGSLSGDGLGTPAERATAVAASNGAEVIACSCRPLETTISVRVRARLIPFGTTVAVRAYARAILPAIVDPSASSSPADSTRPSWSDPQANADQRRPPRRGLRQPVGGSGSRSKTLGADPPTRAGLASPGEAAPGRRGAVVRKLTVSLVVGVAPGGRVGHGGPLVEAVGAPATENRARGLSGLPGALGIAHLTEAVGAAVAVGLVTQPRVLALQFPDASLQVAPVPALEAAVPRRAPGGEQQQREEESGARGHDEELAQARSEEHTSELQSP